MANNFLICIIVPLLSGERFSKENPAENRWPANPDEKKNVTLKHFKHRIRKRLVKEEFKEIKKKLKYNTV